MILEDCTNDFRSLISRIQLMNISEKSNLNNKSIAWEVRKSSPRKTATTLTNYSTSQISDTFESKCSSSMEKHEVNIDQNGSKEEPSIVGGFKDFMPSYENLNQNGNKEKELMSFYGKYTRNGDDDEEEDEYDLEEFDFESNQKIDNDPIDLLNHETFSDMQSIRKLIYIRTWINLMINFINISQFIP